MAWLVGYGREREMQGTGAWEAQPRGKVRETTRLRSAALGAVPEGKRHRGSWFATLEMSRPGLHASCRLRETAARDTMLPRVWKKWGTSSKAECGNHHG